MALSREILEALAYKTILQEWPGVYEDVHGSRYVKAADGSETTELAKADPVTARVMARAVAQIVPYLLAHATVQVDVVTSPHPSLLAPDAQVGLCSGTIE